MIRLRRFACKSLKSFAEVLRNYLRRFAEVTSKSLKSLAEVCGGFAEVQSPHTPLVGSGAYAATATYFQRESMKLIFGENHGQSKPTSP